MHHFVEDVLSFWKILQGCRQLFYGRALINESRFETLAILGISRLRNSLQFRALMMRSLSAFFYLSHMERVAAHECK